MRLISSDLDPLKKCGSGHYWLLQSTLFAGNLGVVDTSAVESANFVISKQFHFFKTLHAHNFLINENFEDL